MPDLLAEWEDFKLSRADGVETPRGRRERLENAFLAWCQYYLGALPGDADAGYFKLPPSKMHRELAVEFKRMLDSPDVERLALAAPRGNAKTTFLLAFILYCIVYRRKRFIIFITSTAELANTFLGDIKAEIEENPRLLEDFPDVCGKGPLWRENVIITRNGVRVQPLGAGKKVRGRKHRQYRPDFVIVDDFEDDEHIRNKDQRNKSYAWLTKAVLNVGGVAVKADFIVSGTLLHFDSVLARILNPKDHPGWRGRIYKAVISWASRGDLWQQWEQIYTDWRRGDGERLVEAKAFFERNRPAMLEGTEVLWPEGENYYSLMCQRVDKGPAAFQSEKQNEPLDPAQCKFPEAWFRWFDEEEIEGVRWIIPEHGDRIAIDDCDVYGACDPSKGRRDNGGDPSAIVTIAAYPSQRSELYAGRYRMYFVLDGDVAWRHPPAILSRILELHALRNYRRFGVEAVQFQELFADDVQERSLTDPGVKTLHVVKLTPNTDKILRIEKLAPYIHGGRMQFSRRVVGAFYDHLRYFDQHPNDDGGDATELTLETIGEIGWVMVSDEDRHDEEDKKRHPLDQQVRARVPQAFEEVTDTCSSCANMGERAGRPWCMARRFEIRPADPACDSYEMKGS